MAALLVGSARAAGTVLLAFIWLIRFVRKHHKKRIKAPENSADKEKISEIKQKPDFASGFRFLQGIQQRIAFALLISEAVEIPI